MEVNKNASYYDQPPLEDYPATDTINSPMPPPYADEPPAYSEIDESSNAVYTSAPMGLDYMSKLPYGDSGNSSSQLPLGVQPFYQEPLRPQMNIQPLFYQEAFNPQISSSVEGIQQPPQPETVSRPQPSTSITIHKDLLQPTASRTVETKKTRRGKTKSHIKDLETGKEYFIKEKVSRNGHRSKTVVKEVGGPKTIVMETPKRTLVCQKKK